MEGIRDLTVVHTFGGIPFYDDKYDEKTARERLRRTLEISLSELKVDTPYVLLTIQPSDDMYIGDSAKRLKEKFTELLEEEPENTKRAVGFKTGYIMCYNNKEIAEYTTDDWKTDSISTYHTDTIPPFFTILFPKETFLDPKKHFDHIGPYKSHEYIKDVMDYTALEGRGFIVGTHGENISTTYNHRYKGRVLNKEEAEDILFRTGVYFSKPLTFVPSARLRIRRFVNLLPFRNRIKEIYYKLPTKLRKV